MKKIVIEGRTILEGSVEGIALVSKQNFSFSHGIDPYTGNICDKSHEWNGKILIIKLCFFHMAKDH